MEHIRQCRWGRLIREIDPVELKEQYSTFTVSDSRIINFQRLKKAPKDNGDTLTWASSWVYLDRRFDMKVRHEDARLEVSHSQRHYAVQSNS